MHIRRAHQDHRHWTEMKIGASSVTTSNLHLRKAALLLLKLKTCRILHAVLILVLVVHPWPVSCSTLNCTIDEIPGVFDGFPACRAGSCRAKYEDKKPYWCDSIRLCVSDRIACNDTDEIPGVPPRSPPPPAEPYCSGAHIRGFDRKTNSCLCEEGW
ncbi:hypothetical protein MPTK1_2g13470 [Marchantia polymorpha subsp. ruderalis]|uniref:Uncharacterized protein n=1 Tax=Marchantia polymorpha TaxID=3197 RepID=A0A2R6XAJ9_MARPO|nr:hypothetical protein MARPO_0026s0024 [Marchantia polymorpha]BBN02185.1 hypothetical protein Mp_2g13470 [Marchantia polymorpha subsp. ruderalis]|eukprot:PTQ43133.1 hypothetical protein MARPO_0026s0024 [Marchantia polymorpha]